MTTFPILWYSVFDYEYEKDLPEDHVNYEEWERGSSDCEGGGRGDDFGQLKDVEQYTRSLVDEVDNDY